jgi:uncharacterized metal-binding protein
MEKSKPRHVVQTPQCNACYVKACYEEPGKKQPPKFCAMETEPELLAAVEIKYQADPQLHQLALESARTEASGYMKRTRIEDIIDFARRMEVQKIGIAHCIGLIEEARIAAEIFLEAGFEVYAACCKVGSISKESFGMDDGEKVRPGTYEALCNPVAQAELLAQQGTQLNVVIGLCVGHDSIFFMNSKAPATVLVAKDRVLGHNPVAALYTSHSYYKRLRPNR